jgi:hypothetical protein
MAWMTMTDFGRDLSQGRLPGALAPPGRFGCGSAFEEDDLFGGTVRVRVCPRRLTRVSKVVACPATVKQPAVVRGQERRKPGQADLAGPVQGQVLGEPPEQFRQDHQAAGMPVGVMPIDPNWLWIFAGMRGAVK